MGTKWLILYKGRDLKEKKELDKNKKRCNRIKIIILLEKEDLEPRLEMKLEILLLIEDLILTHLPIMEAIFKLNTISLKWQNRISNFHINSNCFSRLKRKRMYRNK
jgi:hypothetical protein